jgi:hypothetical protein
LPATAVRTEGGQTYVWTVENGKLAKRSVVVGRRDDAAGRIELKTKLGQDVPVLAAKFDNLKDGAPAIVKCRPPRCPRRPRDRRQRRVRRRPRADARQPKER